VDVVDAYSTLSLLLSTVFGVRTGHVVVRERDRSAAKTREPASQRRHGICSSGRDFNRTGSNPPFRDAGSARGARVAKAFLSRLAELPRLSAKRMKEAEQSGKKNRSCCVDA
jgi:hypothetical protein